MLLPPYTVEIDAPATDLKIGSTGFDVRRVQEWLGLIGHGVAIDGDFGPTTEHALRHFSAHYTGVVDTGVWDEFALALRAAASAIDTLGDFGEVVGSLAAVHCGHKPLEIGGDNKGPWVRHYCRGYEVAWCQGFASTIWMQAAHCLKLDDTPFELTADGQMSLYVPWVVNSAIAAGCFQRGDGPVPEGSMFFLRGGSAGYSHVGIVVADHGDTIETVEGNTSDGGSPNGYEVARRYRKKTSCDYGLPVRPEIVKEGDAVS